MSNSTSNWKCSSCGCTDMAACAGGCYWVAKNKCSACVIRGVAKIDPPPASTPSRSFKQIHNRHRRSHRRGNRGRRALMDDGPEYHEPQD